jgi:photosystem II stability/assembly factor-like uncharacterized protein
METNLTVLRRRSLLGSSLGVFLLTGAGLKPARANFGYPQLAAPAIAVRNPTRIYMVAGASAGGRVFAGGEHGVILYSEDAGKTWHQSKVPVSVTITSLAFATPQVGWATGGFGVVLGTTDGGTSWVKQLDGLQEITLMNTATQAFVAAQPPNSDAAAHATRRAQILAGGGPDKPFLCLLPISASEVFAFGTYRFAEHSTDGGKSWTDWSMNIGDPTSHNIYGAAAIGGAYYLVAEEGLIFRSTDGGKTFPQLAQPGQATFFGICDAGAGGILAYGVAGQMFLSLDDGKTWNPSNFTGSANVNSVALLSSGLLIAGDAGGGIWISLDHGKNFKLIIRNPLISINAIQPLDAARFLLLSDIGIVPIDLSAMRG